MFFEFPESDEAMVKRIQQRPWQGPPTNELGTIVPVNRVVARGPDAVIQLVTMRAYSTGVDLSLEIVNRQGAAAADEWLVLQTGLVFATTLTSVLSRDRVLRVGVRYPDGSKATSLEPSAPFDVEEVHAGALEPAALDANPPTGPMMTWRPTGGGSPFDVSVAVQQIDYWLWPLPPAEPFELAAEWPAWGIPLTFAELDGAQVVAAAERSGSTFPD